MEQKYPFLFLILSLLAFAAAFAQDAPVLTFNIPSQNNLKNNRFLQNPTFSFLREDNTYITLYHRNQWIQFDDSPKVYMLSYTGKFSEKSGLGFGLYQQNIGVITSFGGIANFAYNVPLGKKMDLTVGFNFAYYNSGVNKNATITEEPDPTLMALRNNSLFSIKPGFNLRYGSLDFGIYAENFVDYDFKSNELADDYSNKTFSGHLMYTHKMVQMQDLFQDSEFRLALRTKVNQESDLGLGGSILVNFPRIGWIQTGVDDFFGVQAGLGFHFTKKLSLGYTYERSIKEGLVNLGPTHEITMVFAFQERALARKEALEKEEERLLEETTAEETATEETLSDEIAAEETSKEEAKEKTQKEKKAEAKAKKANKKKSAGFDKDVEIEKLKLDLDESNMHLLEMLVQEDSIAQVKKEEFDEKVKNLMEYAKREKESKKRAAETKPIVLKKKNPSAAKIIPKTIDELKDAADGYYVVSKTVPGEKPIIERHDNLPKAVESYEKRKKSDKEKDIYILHVDNDPDEIEQSVETAEMEAPKGGESEEMDSEEMNRSEEEIKEFFAKKNVKLRDAPKKGNKLTVQGMEPGYYIIANVFSEEQNTERFMNKLKIRGVQTYYFINPKNNYRYVYLRKHKHWKEALYSYYSNVDNTYFDTVWIMSINTN